MSQSEGSSASFPGFGRLDGHDRGWFQQLLQDDSPFSVVMRVRMRLRSRCSCGISP